MREDFDFESGNFRFQVNEGCDDDDVVDDDVDGDGDVSVKALCGHHICKLKASPYCFFFFAQRTVILADDE